MGFGLLPFFQVVCLFACLLACLFVCLFLRSSHVSTHPCVVLCLFFCQTFNSELCDFALDDVYKHHYHAQICTKTSFIWSPVSRTTGQNGNRHLERRRGRPTVRHGAELVVFGRGRRRRRRRAQDGRELPAALPQGSR